MDWDDLQFWVAFDQVEPIGEPRADRRIALAASAICHAMGSKTKPEDLIPWAINVPQEKVQTDAEQIAAVIRICDFQNRG